MARRITIAGIVLTGLLALRVTALAVQFRSQTGIWPQYGLNWRISYDSDSLMIDISNWAPEIIRLEYMRDMAYSSDACGPAIYRTVLEHWNEGAGWVVIRQLSPPRQPSDTLPPSAVHHDRVPPAASFCVGWFPKSCVFDAGTSPRRIVVYEKFTARAGDPENRAIVVVPLPASPP